MITLSISKIIGNIRHFIYSSKDDDFTGECADEIFGGYPWFFREDALKSGTFPWSIAIDERQTLLNPSIAKKVNLKDYINYKYTESLDQVEILDTDSPETAEIVDRKKSPYPKTHNPTYLAKVKSMLSEIMANPHAPINYLLNRDYILNILQTDGKAFSRPWFGQLMTDSQLMAYLCQVNMWLEKYQPTMRI